MKKIALSTVLAALLIGLSGCSTPPEPLPAAPLSLCEKLQNTSADIIQSGGLSAVGIAESKSLDIALNKAKVDGRIKLADLLEAKTRTRSETIQDLAPKQLEHETTNGIFTAYALMELDPKILNPEIKILSAE